MTEENRHKCLGRLFLCFIGSVVLAGLFNDLKLDGLSLSFSILAIICFMGILANGREDKE